MASSSELTISKVLKEGCDSALTVSKNPAHFTPEKTLVIKQITNESWSDQTKKSGVFYIEQKNRDKKGISLTKSDCGKLAIILKEISEK